MKISKKIIIITSVLTILPMIFGLVRWDQLPDSMPTHFGADGTVNDWSDKHFAVFGLPLILLGVHLLCLFARKTDPKSKNYSEKMFGLMVWLIPVLSVFANGIMYTSALGNEMDISLLVMLFVAVLFIIVGNYLPKCKCNYTMGIKLPWTLADENNWNATHRLAGYVWMIGGLVLLINAFVFQTSVLFIAVVMLMLLVLPVYSYMYYCRHGVVEKKD